jgi:hypothetical protein
VVPASYLKFMITSASAAGAMIGLLFVVISLRTDIVFGPHASTRVRALATSSFIGLVNAFAISIIAVVPQTNIGFAMAILAFVGLRGTIKLHRTFRSSEAQYRVLLISSLTYATQFVGGVTLIIRPHIVWIVNGTCYVIFASFIIALDRAWDLIQVPERSPAEREER